LFAGQDPVLSVIDNRLQVTDIAANGPVALRDGARLFRVDFRASSDAIGTFPLIFDTDFTSLSDDEGRRLPMGPPRGGAITILDGIPPKVSEFSVSGTGWTTTFLAHLAAERLGGNGLAIPNGTSQPPVLPWINIDRISIRFSEDVEVQRDDLTLAGISEDRYSFADMTYDAATFTATWILSEPLRADKLTATLAGQGEGAVRDRAGNLLDGHPSPDLVSDYQTAFSVVSGDVDRNGVTNVMDTVKTRNLQFTRAGDDRYSAFYDVDGSGSISVFDTILVKNNQFTNLPEDQSEEALIELLARAISSDRAAASDGLTQTRFAERRNPSRLHRLWGELHWR
jgi:hypothetical protein